MAIGDWGIINSIKSASNGLDPDNYTYTSGTSGDYMWYAMRENLAKTWNGSQWVHTPAHKLDGHTEQLSADHPEDPPSDLPGPSDEYISVADFKRAVTKIVRNKGGALPDVSDWKEIKQLMDKLYDIELHGNVPQPSKVDALPPAPQEDEVWKDGVYNPQSLQEDYYFGGTIGSLAAVPPMTHAAVCDSIQVGNVGFDPRVESLTVSNMTVAAQVEASLVDIESEICDRLAKRLRAEIDQRCTTGDWK
jgi:hypothetical protein